MALKIKEIIEKQRELSLERNTQDIGKTFDILIEGTSKRSSDKMQGRNSANKVVIFEGDFEKGSYIQVKVTDCTAATLFGEVI